MIGAGHCEAGAKLWIPPSSSLMLLVLVILVCAPSIAIASADQDLLSSVSAPLRFAPAHPMQLERPVLSTAQASQKTKPVIDRPTPLRQAGKFLSDAFDVSMGTAFEYDDNSFLVEEGAEPDMKMVLTPAIFFEQSGEKTYVGGSYQVEATRWTRLDGWVVAQQGDGTISWRATPRWTLGVRDTHVHTGQEEVGTAAGVRILRLGFNINTLQVDSRYQLTPVTVLHNQYQFEFIDFADKAQDDFIDRRANQMTNEIEHHLKPDLNLLGGYAYRAVDYKDVLADAKSFESHRLYGGLEKKFARRWTLESVYEFESRDFQDSGHTGSSATRDGADTGSKGEPRGYFNLRQTLTSNFSRFTSVSFSYVRSQGDSSRSEYRQFRSDRIGLNLRHYLTPKTILFGSGSWEVQTYPGGDQMRDLANFVRRQRRTYLWTYDTTLRRILSSMWALEVGYHFSKRDTDFALEGNTNNRVRIGLRATF